MKKNSTASQKLNLFFSAFLVFAYTVCTYFIDSFSVAIANEAIAAALPLILFLVFGLFLFYATRVGDGAPVYRFSWAVLVFMVLPGLYVLLATLLDVLPLHDQLVIYGGNMAKVAVTSLGYGIPFMFVSGFELDNGEVAVQTAEAQEALEMHEDEEVLSEDVADVTAETDDNLATDTEEAETKDEEIVE